MTITGAARVYCLLRDPLAKARTLEYFNGLFAARAASARDGAARGAAGQEGKMASAALKRRTTRAETITGQTLG